MNNIHPWSVQRGRYLDRNNSIIRIEVRRVRVLLDPRSEGSEVGILFKTLENQIKDFEGQVKLIKRRLPQDGSQGKQGNMNAFNYQ